MGYKITFNAKRDDGRKIQYGGRITENVKDFYEFWAFVVITKFLLVILESTKYVYLDYQDCITN
jgi:hypothetical protein